MGIPPDARPESKDEAGRLASRSTWALIGALFALVCVLALCVDRGFSGDV